MPRDATGAAGRPRTLRFALLLVFLEVLALAVAGVLLAVDAALGRVQDAGATMATAVFVVVLAALLAFAARGLWQLRRWGRGPVVTWQVLQFAIGLTQLGAAPLVGGLVAAVAALALGGLLAPASIAATAGDARSG